MRTLTTEEVVQVSGGNGFAGATIQIAGAYYAGYAFGEGINAFNSSVSGMSLGEAIYYALN